MSTRRQKSDKVVAPAALTAVSAELPKIVCVLGMHRSGTSLISGILNILGVFLGSEDALIPRRADNPTGHWEHSAISQINEQLLEALGGSWQQIPELAAGWEHDQRLDSLAESARAAVSQFESNELWGWNDPRTCLTLPFWQRLVSPTHYVICLRNPIDVWRSLVARDGFSLQKSADLWVTHVLSSLKGTERDQKSLIWYEDVLADWHGQADRLREFLGLPPADDAAQTAIMNLIEPSLNHYNASVAEVLSHPALSPSAKELYRWLRSLGDKADESLTAMPATLTAGGLSMEPADAAPPTGTRETTEADGLASQTTLQIFWRAGDNYSQQASVTNYLLADGQPHRYVAELRCGPSELLRIDPGSRAAYWRIEQVKVYAGFDALRAGTTLQVSSADNGFDGLLAGSGISIIDCSESYDFICTSEDPSLFLSTGCDNHNPGPLILEITASVIDLEGQAQKLGERLIRLQNSARQAEEQRSQLTQQVSQLNNANEALHNELAARSSEIEKARQDFEAGRREVLDALRDRETQLRSVRNTLAWAIVTFIGKLKYGYLLPLFRRDRRTGNAGVSQAVEVAEIRRTPTFRLWWTDFRDLILRRKRNITLVPYNDVTRLKPGEYGENAWESTSGDPQLKLDGILPLGWVLITTLIEMDAGAHERSTVFLDEGEGYRKSNGYDLGPVNEVAKLYLKIGPEVERIRLDPIEGKGRFRVARFSLQRVTRLEAELLHKPRPAAEPFETPDELRPPPLFKLTDKLDPYDAWLEVNQWSDRRESVLRSRLRRLSPRPLLSVVMPVYDPPIDLLNRAIESIAGQIYENWELCIVDDASSNPDVISTLEDWARRNHRIRRAFKHQNGGISRATNDAANLAAGEFLVFVDNDDEISEDALAEVALYIDEHPQTDVVYSDSDKIDIGGRRYGPEFKPDWSPELFLSYMYMNHLLVVRNELFLQAGGDRTGFEGAQDYDMVLRVTEHAGHVGHIPKVLYHWRALPGSTAASGNAKPASFEAGRKAVAEALARRNVAAKTYQPEWAVRAGCGIFAQEFADDGPGITIIIPTKNNFALLMRCVESLKKTSYRNYRVLIADNENDDPRALEYLNTRSHRVVKIPNKDSSFSFAYLNNKAVTMTETEYILFLNDDTEVISANWLSQMAGYLGIPGVGAVGARLVYPDGRIQHAGVVQGYFNGLAGHAFKLMPSVSHGYLAYAAVARNYSAVTAACMLTRRDLFLQLGGFDEQTFPVAYNDVDYCCRLAQAGYRSVYCPSAELIHAEGSSRGFKDTARERAAFKTKYRFFRDSYYNSNLSLADEQFRINARTQAVALERPIRALMVGFNLNLEGAPFDQLEMTAGLKESGIIDPIVYSPTDGPLRQEYESKGIEVKVFSHPLASVLFTADGYALGIRGFADWIRSLGVELVYGNTLPTFYAIAAATELGLPSIWNPREGEPWQTYFKSFGPYVATKALECFNYPYKIVFTANASERKFEPLNSHHNFMTIHDGLDRGRFERLMSPWPREKARAKLGVSEDEVVALMVGTVCERKAQLDLLQAVDKLRGPAAQKIRVFIVGDRPGEYSSMLAQAHSRLDREKKAAVTIVPETSEVFEYYAAADIYVCCSRFESFPRVILEAMAAGLPVITTPVDGIVEQVREDSNAMFFAPGDIDALADKLTAVINDPDLRRRMGANSVLELDSIIDYESMVRAYGQVFQEAWLSGKPRGI